MTTVFSRNIKALRFYSGLKQSEIAKMIGISDKNWSSYERGATEPNIEKLLKIAKAFNVSVDALIQQDMQIIAKNLIHSNAKLVERISKNANKGNREPGMVSEPPLNYVPKVITEIRGLLNDVESRLSFMEEAAGKITPRKK